MCLTKLKNTRILNVGVGTLTSGDEHPRGAGHPGQALHTGGRTGQAEGGYAIERLRVHQPEPVMQIGHQEVIRGQRVPLQGCHWVLFIRSFQRVGPQNMSLIFITC